MYVYVYTLLKMGIVMIVAVNTIRSGPHRSARHGHRRSPSRSRSDLGGVAAVCRYASIFESDN